MDPVARQAAAIEALIGRDVNQRGTGALAVPGDLLAAGRALVDARSVLIATGFYVPRAGKGETDGPPGAAVLARALEHLGIEVCLVTDRFSAPLLEAARSVVPFAAPVHRFPVRRTDAPARDRQLGAALLARHGVTHAVAIERIGPAADGRFYSAAGEDLTRWAARIDRLFRAAGERTVATVGIGDGGNEIGMGKVHGAVCASVPGGPRIACCLATDYLVAAGISNWGAYGLVAVISLLAGRTLLHTAADEVRLLRAVVAAGAVDGLLGARAPSVDGQGLEAQIGCVTALEDLVGTGRARAG